MVWIVIFGFIIGFALAFSIGANDVANSFGTSVGSKVLTLRSACILATIFESAGSVLVGAKVSNTISKGIIDIELYTDAIDLLRLGYLSALIGASLWLMLATVFKLPVSGTHSIVGAVVGFTLVSKGFGGVNWPILGKIGASWFVSPVLSGLVSAGIYMFVRLTILRCKDHKKQLNRGIMLLPLFYSVTFAINSFSVVFHGPRMLYFHLIPWWGALIISFGIGLIAAAIVRFVVGPRLKRHIVKSRPQPMLMSNLTDKHDSDFNVPSHQVEQKIIITSDTGVEKQDCNNDAPTSDIICRLPSVSDSGKYSMGVSGFLPTIPFLDQPMTPEYCGIPSGFASSSNASGINSTDVSGSSTPLLVTPRSVKGPPSLNLAAQKYMTGATSATPPNSPELPTRCSQNFLSSLTSSVANSSETLVTVISAIDKKAAKYCDEDPEDEEQETIVPGTSLQASLRQREASEPANKDNKDEQADPSEAGHQIPKRKRTQSGRSILSVTSSRLEGNSNDWPDVLKLFAFLQILTACFGAFAHGGNDVSNAVGPVIGLYQLHGSETIPVKVQPQWWILLLGGVGISIGLWTLGRRVIETVGKDLTEVTPPSGFSIEIGAATTVLLASQIGIPVSTTHCKVGSVVFVGLTRGRSQVDWRLFRNIVLAWFITVPASASFSAGVMAILRELFYVSSQVDSYILNGSNFTTTPPFFNMSTSLPT